MARISEVNVDERRQKMIEKLYSDGKIKCADLSRLFSVSEVTIRNDLLVLEHDGLLERVHGGAIQVPKAYFSKNYNERRNRNTDEKLKIAKLTAGMISNGETVFLNSGTTTYFVVEELKRLQTLTIVTNSIMIAMEFGDLPNFNIILLGGNIDSRHSFTYGDDAVTQLKKYRADKLILSIDGISLDKGITTYYFQEVEINKTMMERVDNIIIVADYSKIGTESFSYVSTTEQVNCIVTNSTAEQLEISKLKSAGIEVLLT